MIKFIVDVGVSAKVERWLESAGYDIIAVRDINPSMDDQEIIKIANNDNRMIITMDKDFGELVFKSNMGHHGILLLRLEDAKASEKLNVIKNIIQNYMNEIQNNFCVYQNDRLRIRKK